MAIEKVKEYFSNYGMEDRVQEFEVSSATVELAAEALGCEPCRIAKTLSFMVNEKPILIVAAGDVKIDNKKFKARFETKAKMIAAADVENLVGHAVGGVCPFAVNENVKVYLDESLKRFQTVFPACGSSNSAIELTLEELERYSSFIEWIDVCKKYEGDWPMRILIAEDEVELAKGLKYLLEKNKFSVDIVHNGRDALDYFHVTPYDAVVLDIMMPKMNGLEVLETIRREKSGVPVMMLTAKAEVEDRVAGLEAGADDYLPKPFATREFIARVKALVRRNGSYTDNILTFGNVQLDCNRYELSAGKEMVRLNNKEYQMMELFFRNPHLVFSSERIMDKVWGQDSEAGMDVVWTYVGFLRRKLKQLGADVEIKTVRGAGYLLEEIQC